MTIEVLKGKELEKTRLLYEEVFHDSREYTDYFYEKIQKQGTAFVVEEDKRIVSELFLIPKLLSCKDRIMETLYLYGVATKKEYRGQGFMGQLMENALDYAVKTKAELVYLIPVNENLYRRFGFQTIKQGNTHIWELTEKEAEKMLKFNFESVSSENFSEEVYREINMLENKIKEPEEILPFRDREYLIDRIRRAQIEGGGVYLLRKHDDYMAAGMIMTAKEQGETVILDVIGRKEKREHCIKDFMRWKNSMRMKEYIFTVMIKTLNGKKAFSTVLLNDEI